MLTTHMKILTPLRYPLTAESTQTLAHAKQLASNADDEHVQLFVLYVNIFQNQDNVQEAEIRRAITPLLNGLPVAVLTRRGFLVEEVILDEAQYLDVDYVVIGKNKRPWWRRVLTQLVGGEIELAPFLRKNAGPDVAVEVVG